MALNLPQVPFKLTPQDMGGFDLGAALSKGMNLRNQTYTDQMIKADIFHKMISPLANIAISPLGMALAPHQQKQIQNYIGQALQQFGGNGQQQQKQGGSLFDTIKQHLGFGGDVNQPHQQQGAGGFIPYDDNQNPVGDMLTQRTQEGLEKEQVAPDVITGTQGNQRLTASSEIRQDTSRQAVGKKILNNSISDLVKDVKNLSGKKGLIGNAQQAAFGASGAPLPDFVASIRQAFIPAKLKQKQAQVVGHLIKYYGYSQKEAQGAVEKGLDENPQDYANRLLDLGKTLAKSGKVLTQATQSGVPLGGQETSPPTIDLSKYTDEELLAIAGQNNTSRGK